MIDVPPSLLAGMLAVGALVLVGPGPSWVARWTFLHRVPRAAVVLWQAGALAALGCVFALAYLLLGAAAGSSHWWSLLVTGLVVAFAALVAVRLAWALARVARTTGARRRRHRDLVDLLARVEVADDLTRPPGLRVLAEARPLAYCLPGLKASSRVVLSAGTLRLLSKPELAAVLAHEQAHLRARHDLVLDAFDAVHEAFPHAIRSELPAQQSRLLVEMLADDAAVRSVGRGPLGRALVAMSESTVPDVGLGLGRPSTRLRLERLADRAQPSAWLAAALYALAAGLVLAPPLALVAAG